MCHMSQSPSVAAMTLDTDFVIPLHQSHILHRNVTNNKGVGSVISNVVTTEPYVCISYLLEGNFKTYTISLERVSY